jgi:hypothetical protein
MAVRSAQYANVHVGLPGKVSQKLSTEFLSEG